MRIGVAMVLGLQLLQAQTSEKHPFDSLGAGEILSRGLGTMPDDLRALAVAPFEHPKTTGLFFGGVVLLVALDRPLTEGWQKQVEPRVDYRMKGLWTSQTLDIKGPDTWLLASLPAWYFGSLAAGSGKGQVAAVLGTKAVLYSYLVSHVVLKTAFARERPNPALGVLPAEAPKTDSPWAWGRFHRPAFGESGQGTAFPSFHATLYVAAASVFAEVYGQGWIPYTLAAVLYGSNLKDHRHWVSDQVAGAAIGIGIGKTVVREFRGVPQGSRGSVAWSVQPWTDLQTSAGLAIRAVW